jgi:hypothetical protein
MHTKEPRGAIDDKTLEEIRPARHSQKTARIKFTRTLSPRNHKLRVNMFGPSAYQAQELALCAERLCTRSPFRAARAPSASVSGPS